MSHTLDCRDNGIMVTVVREEDSSGAMAVKNGDGWVESWMPPFRA